MARGKIYPNFFLVTLLRNIVRGVRCSLSLAIRCLPILNDAMFRQCFDVVFDDVLKKPKHLAYDTHCFGNISRSKKEPRNISATNATSISFIIIE